MTSEQLTPEQARRLLASVQTSLDYLDRMLKRMQQRHFPRADPLWERTENAYRTTMALATAAEIECSAR